jgi:hypothetical protein
MKTVFILLLLAGTTFAQVLNPFVSHPPIPQFKDGVSVGNFDSSTNWQEISGMAPATLPANSAYFWVVSDSPANMLACVSKVNASNQGVWTLTSAPAFSDIEDVATARISGQSYVYVADFGDNGNARATFNLFRCKEPAVTGSDGSIAAVDYETITCAYPGGGGAPSHKDAECLLVDPDTGDMYVITKREAVPGVYQLLHAASYSGTQTLTDMGNMFDIPDITTVPLGATACNVTSGSISRSGKEIVVKNYDATYYFARPDKTVSIMTTLQQTPVQINYVGGGSSSGTYLKRSHPSAEPQGEGTCWDQDDQNLFSCSEYISTEGSTASRYPLFRYDRISAAPTTITFQEGVSPTGAYAGTLDTYIWDTNPTTDNGAGTSMVVDTAIGVETDQRKALLKFDISAIPTTAKVVSATLELYINTEGQGWKFHKMLVTWGESSTYNSLTAGIDNDGTDAATAADCINGINLDTLTGTTRNNMLVDTVQAWVSNPSSNFGWVIEQIDSSTGDGVQFDTSEGATASRRPKLTVKYN